MSNPEKYDGDESDVEYDYEAGLIARLAARALQEALWRDHPEMRHDPTQGES